MLITLATLDFRLFYLLNERLTKVGFEVEHINPDCLPNIDSALFVTTEHEDKKIKLIQIKKVVLTNNDILNINKAYSKILLGLEGKKIWESLIIGVDPGITIGIAVVTDSCLRSTFETREIKEAIDFITTTIKNTPAKMVIIRVGSAGGYKKVLLLNDLLEKKPKDVTIEVVDELETTPSSYQEVKKDISNASRVSHSSQVGKDATAALEIALRLGEHVTSPEPQLLSEGELKEIQILSRQYSRGKVTISKELAKKVAYGLLSLEEAIEIQKKIQV